MFTEELDVLKHVGGEFPDGAGPQLAAGPVGVAGDVLVEVEPVSKLKLKSQHSYLSGVYTCGTEDQDWIFLPNLCKKK